MKQSRFTEEQIVGILRETDAGGTVKDVCRRHGVSTAAYYQWKSKYSGLDASDLKRLRELQHEKHRWQRDSGGSNELTLAVLTV